MEDRLIRTPHYYSVITHYCFVPGERKPSLRTSDVSPRSSPLRDVSRRGNVPRRRWARRNFCHSQAKESPYIFYKFNPLNTDAALIQTLFMTHSVSLLTGFDCCTVSNWRVQSCRHYRGCLSQKHLKLAMWVLGSIILRKAPCKRTQHCWMLHVAPVCTPCCMLLRVVGVVAQSLKPVKLLIQKFPTFL